MGILHVKIGGLGTTASLTVACDTVNMGLQLGISPTSVQLCSSSRQLLLTLKWQDSLYLKNSQVSVDSDMQRCMLMEGV